MSNSSVKKGRGRPSPTSSSTANLVGTGLGTALVKNDDNGFDDIDAFWDTKSNEPFDLFQ